MPSPSDVQIASNALLMIGAGTISSFSESNDRARLIANLYEQTRNATLRAHPWKFAQELVVLGPLLAAPPFGWSAAFQLPGDWLRTVQVGETPQDKIAYMERGRTIVANETSLPLVYIKEVTDPTVFDALFIDTLAARIAFTCAFPLTKDKALQDAMLKIYLAKLAEARFVDGVSSPPQDLDEGNIIRSRRLSG